MKTNYLNLTETEFLAAPRQLNILTPEAPDRASARRSACADPGAPRESEGAAALAPLQQVIARRNCPVEPADTETSASRPDRLREQEITAWVLLVMIVVVSLSAGFLLWAKASAAWPF